MLQSPVDRILTEDIALDEGAVVDVERMTFVLPCMIEQLVPGSDETILTEVGHASRSVQQNSERTVRECLDFEKCIDVWHFRVCFGRFCTERKRYFLLSVI